MTTATGQRVFRVVGRGGLNHQFGRTWLARAEYERSVRYVEAFVDPLFADATDVTFDGFLSRRIDMNARVGASRGTVGLAAGNTSSLFRLDPATHVATRVEVRTGRVSVDRVEVLSGLASGDAV